ncbi:kinase-like domain-containing protein [Mycena galericulata]|nr:kinase-like domain-containing protein [Mycena galericulata]
MTYTPPALFISRPLENIFNRYFVPFSKTNVDEPAVETTKVSPTPKPIVPQLSDFEFVRFVGSGTASKVYLVRQHQTGELYALKVVRKDSGRVPGVLEEQRISRTVAESEGSRFLISLVASWHDCANFYLLFPYYEGGDMASELMFNGPLSKERAKLYLAQSMIALETLHSFDAVHRDVKPANLFFGRDGNIVIGDFGCGRLFQSTHVRGQEPTYVNFVADPDADSGSFNLDLVQPEFVSTERCGTLAFMSPSQLCGMPYSYDADVWSLGVTFFFMLTGRWPFAGIPQTVEDYRRIVSLEQIVFKPEDNLDEETRDVVRWLLVKNRPDRMTLPEMRSHPYFRDIDWAALAEGRTPTSWRPHVLPVPQTARPYPFAPGTPYEEGTDPLPAFSFVSPRFRHAVQATPAKKTWRSRLQPCFFKSRPVTGCPIAITPPPVPTPVADPKRDASPPAASKSTVKRWLSDLRSRKKCSTPPAVLVKSSYPSPVEQQTPRGLFQTVIHRHPGFGFTAPCSSDDKSDPPSDVEGDLSRCSIKSDLNPLREDGVEKLTEVPASQITHDEKFPVGNLPKAAAIFASSIKRGARVVRRTSAHVRGKAVLDGQQLQSFYSKPNGWRRVLKWAQACWTTKGARCRC